MTWTLTFSDIQCVSLSFLRAAAAAAREKQEDEDGVSQDMNIAPSVFLCAFNPLSALISKDARCQFPTSNFEGLSFASLAT
jgi:hypothetical protein